MFIFDAIFKTLPVSQDDIKLKTPEKLDKALNNVLKWNKEALESFTWGFYKSDKGYNYLNFTFTFKGKTSKEIRDGVFSQIEDAIRDFSKGKFYYKLISEPSPGQWNPNVPNYENWTCNFTPAEKKSKKSTGKSGGEAGGFMQEQQSIQAFDISILRRRMDNLGNPPILFYQVTDEKEILKNMNLPEGHPDKVVYSYDAASGVIRIDVDKLREKYNSLPDKELSTASGAPEYWSWGAVWTHVLSPAKKD